MERLALILVSYERDGRGTAIAPLVRPLEEEPVYGSDLDAVWRMLLITCLLWYLCVSEINK